MGKYIHKFTNIEAFNAAYSSIDYHEPWVSLTKSINRVNYNKTSEEELLTGPLTITALGTGTITTPYSSQLKYKKNDGDWTTLTQSNNTISVVNGDKIQIVYDSTASYDYLHGAFSGTCDHTVSGNITSLFTGSNYANYQWIEGDVPVGMFENDTHLTSAANLILPNTTCSECYYSLFKGCTALTEVPTLPATELSYECYASMFEGCTSLTTAPVLPATTLEIKCYEAMFKGCTSLQRAPELLATNISDAYNCYQDMFNGCTSLNYIKCLATSHGGDYMHNWTKNVAASGTFIASPNCTWPINRTEPNSDETTGWSYYSGIPENWVRNDIYDQPVAKKEHLEFVTPSTFTYSGTCNTYERYTAKNIGPEMTYDNMASSPYAESVAVEYHTGQTWSNYFENESELLVSTNTDVPNNYMNVEVYPNEYNNVIGIRIGHSIKEGDDDQEGYATWQASDVYNNCYTIEATITDTYYNTTIGTLYFINDECHTCRY